MPHTPINLDDFPASAYARELQRSTQHLRFADPLESEYTQAHLQRNRLRVKVWFSLNVALTIFFTVGPARSSGTGSLDFLLHVGVVLPCSAVLAWLPWSGYYERWYLSTACVLVPLYSALIAVFEARGISLGHYEQLAVLPVNLMAVFFFSGLMFRESLLSAAMMLVAFTAAAAGIGVPHAVVLKSLVVLVLTSIIGAIAHRDIEKSHRKSFLEGALIGELASRDALTGLMNRRAFDEHLRRVWQHALRDRRSIALLMIDIDHFKHCNDAFGHQAGDVALRSVARAVQEFAQRPLDMAARFGGEEFAVILYDLALPHVKDMAERIRLRVQSLQINRRETDTTTMPSVTVSIGVALASPTIGRTPQGAIQLADEALYEAKHAGRNCVVVKGSEDYRLLDTGAFKASRISRLQP